MTRKKDFSPQTPKFLIGLVSLVTFLIILQALSRIPPDFYQNRDDGIITLSQGRNLVDFGFIGVNRSGEIVEASSSPLQAGLFASIYAFTDISYQTFFHWQGLIFTALLLVCFPIIFAAAGLSIAHTLAASLTAAFMLTYSGSWMIWQFAGMENCIVHCVLIGLVALLLVVLPKEKFPSWYAIPVAVGSVARVEMIYEVLPLLVLFCILHIHRHKNRQAIRFLAVFVLGWGALQGLRIYMTGSFFPNTAQAQGINLGNNLKALLLNPFSVITIDFIKLILQKELGYLVIYFLPLLACIEWTKQKRDLVLMLSVLLSLGFARPFIFGPSRLDPVRTISYLTPVTALFSALILFSVSRKFLLNAALASLVFFTPFQTLYSNPPYWVCCDAKQFENFSCWFKAIAREQNIPSALVAAPDLGVLSFHKRFNVFDLGLLGNPTFFQLPDDEAKEAYFYDVAAPDLIDLTPYWRNKREPLFESQKLNELYQVVSQVPVGCAPENEHMFFVRRALLHTADDLERRFLNSLQQDLSAEKIIMEIENCDVRDAAKCMYIIRSVFRFLPELRRSGEIGNVLQVLEDLPQELPWVRWAGSYLRSDRDRTWLSEVQDVVKLRQEK